MNSISKPNGVQPYQLLLYRKALHPTLFPLRARRALTHGAYELEAWVMPGGHLLRFRHNGFCSCELLTPQEDSLPVDGAVTSLLAAGEHDFEHRFDAEKVTYITTVQSESLNENLYSSTYDEMIAFAAETGALLHTWTDRDGGKSLALLDLQHMSREVHAQSYHLAASTGMVLRTQSIFEHR